MPGFHVHRAARLEALCGALAATLKAGLPADPLAPIPVAVGSRSMERWLRHHLADAMGICANLVFPSPARAIAGLYAGEADPRWSPDALTWTLLAVLPGLLDHPDLAPLRAWLRREGDGGAAVRRDRWALAREIAGVLDRATQLRPEWIAAWEAGDAPDGPAPWQGTLWRALRVAIPGPPPTSRLRGAVPLAGDPLHVFGVASLPPLWLDALRRAGEVRSVHLFLSAPSPADRARLRESPLLASLGGVSLAMRERLVDARDVEGGFAEPGDGTLLHALQSDVLRARGPAEIASRRPGRPLRPGDDSLQVHACHGPTRQVEALREALLELLDAHPTLQPRDVLVMTPDVATFAPLVQALFSEGHTPGGWGQSGGWGEIGGPRLPVHVTDLGLRSLNPLADTLLRVLALVEGRLGATALVDVAALDPVRRRFGLDDEDLDRLRTWLDDAGARWGADAAERAAHGNPAQYAYTLAFALDRLALGVAMPDDGTAEFAGVAPYDEMEGAGVRSFGKVAELCARLERWRAALRAPRPMGAWVDALVAMVDDLAAVEPAAGFLRAELYEGLDALRTEAGAFEGDVALDVLTPLLDARFVRGRAGERPSSGAITLCGLSPMRVVPARVLCLLGLDDGAFPRRPTGRAFDAALAAPLPGDPDPREEDRHLLLEALLSAREHLLVFYTGRDVRTDKALAAAVPVGALLDVVDQTAATPVPGRPTRDFVLRRHAVQPFSASGLGPAAAWPARPRPRRFDRRMWSAATALAERRATVAPLLSPDDPLPDPTPPVSLTLTTLIRWLRRPVRTLVRERLGLYLDDEADTRSDREALELDALEKWALGAALSEGWLAGQRDPDVARRRLSARNRLPPGAPGRAAFEEAWAPLAPAWAAAGDVGPRRRREVHVEIDGVALTGGVVTQGDVVLDFAVEDPSKPRRLLQAWVALLALRAAGHADVRAARLVGLAGKKPVVIELQPPVGPADVLAGLLELVRAARQRPLRLVEKCSCAYAMAAPEDALGAAREAWQGRPPDVPGEADDAALQAVFGDGAPYDDPEFARLALDLWAPIQAARGGM